MHIFVVWAAAARQNMRTQSELVTWQGYFSSVAGQVHTIEMIDGWSGYHFLQQWSLVFHFVPFWNTVQEVLGRITHPTCLHFTSHSYFLFPIAPSSYKSRAFNLPGQWEKNVKKNQISSSQLRLHNPCVEIWITDAPRFGTFQSADMTTRADFHTEKHKHSSIIKAHHSFFSWGCETTL